MYVVGIDLSGPSNPADSVVTVFCRRDGDLQLMTVVVPATDDAILSELAKLTADSEVAVGIDAPLSYNDGGGDRSSDASLRRRIVNAGLASGSVMPPTMTRMAYLTLRGVCVARFLSELPGPPAIVEVHPGATMALRGAPVSSVRLLKHEQSSRRELLAWLEEQGLKSVSENTDPSDHYVAACAAALAAWSWAERHSVWLFPAAPPLHPFDFAC